MYIRKGNMYEIGMERKGAKYEWLSGFAKSDSRFFMFGFGRAISCRLVVRTVVVKAKERMSEGVVTILQKPKYFVFDIGFFRKLKFGGNVTVNYFLPGRTR